MFPSSHPSRDHEPEHGQDVPSDSEPHSASTGSGTETSPSPANSNSNRDAEGHQPLLPPSAPAPAPHDSDSSTPTPASRPPAARTDSGPSTIHSASGHGSGNGSRNRNRNSLGLGLPPPHALPTDTQPIMLQLNPGGDVPSSGGGYNHNINAPQSGSPPPTLPPHPAHPALALMRSNTGAGVPRRPLSAPRIPSTRTVTASTGNVNGVGNGNGNGNGAQRASYVTASSMEKDRVLFDSDAVGAPMSPSGRVLQVDLPEFGGGGGGGRYHDGGDRDRDSRYRDGGMRTSMTMPSAYGYDGREVRERGRMMGMGMGAGAGGGSRGGMMGMSMNDKGRRGTYGAYMDVESEIGIPRLPRTVNERLESTMKTVKDETEKYKRKAKMSGYALNIAIGLQVFLSALITALSAVTSGRRTQVMTSVLGGAGTVVASYLARARGSSEPELSITRVKDLQRFQRACDAFREDCGEETGFEAFPGRAGGDRDGNANTNGNEGEGEKGREWDGGVRARELDERIRRLRNELEHLLGNGDGERKLSPA